MTSTNRQRNGNMQLSSPKADISKKPQATQIVSPPNLSIFSAEEMLSLSERAYRRLRDAITGGTLAPHTPVSERTLALQLGISAQPVREAMRRLETEGMIVTAPRRGSTIADFSVDRLEEMGLIRIGLEGTAAAILAHRATEEQVTRLRDQMQMMAHYTRNANLVGLAEGNQGFHEILHECTGNVLLIRTLEAVRAYEQYGRDRNLRSWPGEPARALREHGAILAAIRAHNPDLAQQRMRDHVERALILGGLVRLSPDAAKRLRHLPPSVRSPRPLK